MVVCVKFFWIKIFKTHVVLLLIPNSGTLKIFFQTNSIVAFARYIFWSDWNRQNPRIERANMDGSERKVLVSDKLGLPNGLYYDHHRRELCWGDAKMKTIECVRDDGSNRRVILTDQTTMIFGLTDGLQYAYWTDWSTYVERISIR